MDGDRFLFQKAFELSAGTPGENYARYLYLQNKLVLENQP